MRKSGRKKSIGESLAALLHFKGSSKKQHHEDEFNDKDKFIQSSNENVFLVKSQRSKTLVDRGEQTEDSYLMQVDRRVSDQQGNSLILPPNYSIIYVNDSEFNRRYSNNDQGRAANVFYSQFENGIHNTQQEPPAYQSTITQNRLDNKVKIQIRYENDKQPPSEVEQQCTEIESLDELTEDQHYEYQEKAIDVPAEFERDAYLVFGINQRRSPFRRKICPPIRQIQPVTGWKPEQTQQCQPSTVVDAQQDDTNQQRKPVPKPRSVAYTFGSRLQLNNKRYSVPESSVRNGYAFTMKPLPENGVGVGRVPLPYIKLDKATNDIDHVAKINCEQHYDPFSRIDTNNILRRSSENFVHTETSAKRNNNEKCFDNLSKVNNKSHGGSLTVLNNQLQIDSGASSATRKFGGSVQNLLNIGRNSMREAVKKKFCKSENNLVEIDSKKSKIQSFFTFSKTKVSPLGGSDADLARVRKVSEPKNWKAYFHINNNGVKKTKAQPEDNNKRLQDLDNSFFEKFGSLLRQKSLFNDENIRTPLAALSEETTSSTEENESLDPEKDQESDSGIELRVSPPESDESDTEDGRKSVLIEELVGWNIEELYEEILYETLHNVGCDDEELSNDVLFSYLQDAFKISNERHEEYLEAAKIKEAPEIRLNVEVIEAKDLRPKDANGMSDPFVTMFIQSNPTHRYNTSVKSETLSPLWEEHFSLAIADNANEEILVVEVWDFDPAETVREKITKISEVKGVKGFRKLLKEVIVTASTGKHDNELIGRACIPLKTIPASGMAMWFSLEKKNKTANQGVIKIRLSFSSEKNRQVAAQEHRHLLRMLLLHELETSKVAPFWWAGKFSSEAETILTQHSAQSGLSPADLALVRWSVFSDIHVSHPLSFSLFDSILDKLIRPIQSQTASSEEIKIFWDATIKFLPSCYSIIRKIRKLANTEKNGLKTITDVLNIFSKLSMLEPPEGTDLFPSQLYGWLRRPNAETSWDLREALNDAVHSGARSWFNKVNQESQDPNETNEEKLQLLVKIIQLVRSDLQKAIEYYDKAFQTIFNFRYASALYLTYDAELVDLIEPAVMETCKNLKQVNYNTEFTLSQAMILDDINMGTTLFELFLVLKRFAMLGTALCPTGTVFLISEFHTWFFAGVKHWLDISVYKAKTRIAKAIDLDQLYPVDETVKYSSSAVDTLAIFYQIKVFWQQLDWPEAEGAFTFVGKIIDDICHCCDFYADTMSVKVEGFGEVQSVYEKKFEVTQQWCLAINNIDYIRQSLPPFVKELGADDVIAKLGEFRSPMEAQRCSETLKNVIENALDTEKNRILELIETVAEKMSPALRKFLTEGAELLNQDSNSMDRVMMYLEDSLKTLNSELNELNFERMLDAIWREIAKIMEDMVQTNLDKRRPPSFYANLLGTLNMMVINFRCADSNGEMVCSDQDNLERVQHLLRLHAFETSELIHQYYKDRLVEQTGMTEKPFGQLTLQCFFKENVLEVEILSARNLLPMNSDGTCDAFVKLHFWPEDKFVNVTKPKTNSQSKTLFPLFEERFVIQLTPEQRAISDAIIMFSVKDKDYFGMSNQYLAECFLSFADIADITNDTGSIQQIHLTLNRPKKLDSECLRALEHRQGDKQAREFLKKLKQKSQ